MNAPHVTLSLLLPDEAATAHLMEDLALLVSPNDVITLSGLLGAGKSSAARAMIRYLSGDAGLEVPSPTFTLVQAYDLPSFTLLHADLYRVNDPQELDELGLSPLPDGTVALIEWPERAGETLPADRIDISLAHRPAFGAETRAVTITGIGRSAATVARLGALRDFLDGAQYLSARRTRMAGDASTRSYARLDHGEGSRILMNAPRRPDGPAVHDGKSYSAAVHLAEDVRPFVAIAEGLRAQNISTPVIHHADLETGFLITEDFGVAGFIEGDPPRPVADRIEAATDMLAALHARDLPHSIMFGPDQTFEIPAFDIDAMLIEVSLMPDWYLPDRGAPLRDEARAAFFALWRELLGDESSGETTWVLRDFHSPNLIWLAERAGTARVGVIDFQDAVRGPAAYDVVSLLQDARIDVPETLELSMLSRYAATRRAADAGFDPSTFARSYAVMSAQRNTRLLGTFARLNRRDGKPHYLKHQPRIWTYLSRSLAHPALAHLRDWFTAHVPAP